VEAVLGDEMGMDEVRIDLPDEAPDTNMPRPEGKVEVPEPGGDSMLGHVREGDFRRLVGDEVDFMVFPEMPDPPRGVGGSGIGNETEPQGNPLVKTRFLLRG